MIEASVRLHQRAQGPLAGMAERGVAEVVSQSQGLGQILVEDDVVIGAGAKLLFKLGQTLTVGRGAVIGANAVVLSSVPPGEIWAGMPARKVSVRNSWLEGRQIPESEQHDVDSKWIS